MTRKFKLKKLFFRSCLVTGILSTALGLCPGWAKSTQPTDIKARTKTQKSNQTTKINKKTKPVKKRVRRKKSVFVPPPPPSIPSVYEGGSMSMGSTIAVDYMSLKDLKWKLSSLQKQLSTLELDMKDSLATMKESKKRSETFDSLFEEGVVSKKELLQAKREAKRIGRSVQRDQLEIDETKRVIAAIESRIKVLERSKSKKRVKKKRTKRTKKK